MPADKITRSVKDRSDFQNRYINTKVKTDDFVAPGRVRYERWRPPDIDMTEYDIYTVGQSDLNRPDLIAHKMYGDVSLWWVIMYVNNIFDPFRDLCPGMVLKVPPMEAVIASFAEVTE